MDDDIQGGMGECVNGISIFRTREMGGECVMKGGEQRALFTLDCLIV